MLSPNQVVEMLAEATGPVKPIPTVIPTPPEWHHASHAGHTTLWVVFALMTLSAASFTFLAWNIPVSRRLYHVLTTTVVTIAALSYFAMATGQGLAFHCDRVTDRHDQLPDTHHVLCRPVYWARYVDWALTTPLLLVDLCLLAGISGGTTLTVVLADLVMVISGLFAASGRGGGHGGRQGQKWGWFAIACVAFLVVVWQVALHGTRMVKARGTKVRRLFGGLGIFTLVLWTLYPIVWALGDGAHMMNVDAEIIAYAVLDVLAKGVFGFWLLFSHRRMPETNVEVGGYWAHGLGTEGVIRLEDDGGA